MLGSHSYVDALVSKWDVIQLSPQRQEAESFIADVEQRLKTLLEPRVARIRFERVSSRPLRESGLPALYNLTPIVRSWIEDTPHIIATKPLDIPQLNFEFDRYLL